MGNEEKQINDSFEYVVSFRVECAIDWLHLAKELENAGIDYELDMDKTTGTDFEMSLSKSTIDDVFDCMCKVVDGHVMCDTIRPVPLAKNPLTRRYNDKTKPTDWMAEYKPTPADEAFAALVSKVLGDHQSH